MNTIKMFFKFGLSKFLLLMYFECFNTYCWNFDFLLITCVYLSDENWRGHFVPLFKILQWHQAQMPYYVQISPSWSGHSLRVPLLNDPQCTRHSQLCAATYKSPICATLFHISLSSMCCSPGQENPSKFPNPPFIPTRPPTLPGKPLFTTTLIKQNHKMGLTLELITWICILLPPSSSYLTTLGLCEDVKRREEE